VILYPAIDLKNGQCVRLRQGDMARATLFNRDPAAQALAFEAAGFRALHLVDLDGAHRGRSVNAQAVQRVRKASLLPIQLGGGVRDLAAAEGWFEAGIDRIVLGTLAVRDPETAEALCRRFPGRIAIAVDSRRDRIAIEGWAETCDMNALDLAERFCEAGVACFVYTDIERDGMMTGIDAARIAAFARAASAPVIASGGIASLDDLRALKREESSGIAGAIIGRALYEGRIDAEAALDLAAA
jgi:phosphoribosylformimino-5-aminoimidazole carboxamide ribotide isomerase